MELRKAILPDFEVLYQLRCEDTNVRWTGHKEAPNKDNFQDWFIKTLNNPTRDIYLYWEDNTCIGYLYVDTIASKQYEIAYGISECYQGKGYATLMIAECLRQIGEMGGESLLLHIFQNIIRLPSVWFSTTSSRKQKSVILQIFP